MLTCGVCCAPQILVVEKDAIFQRLAEDRLWEVLPCVLITAKGFPDLATRAFLHKVSQGSSAAASVLSCALDGPESVLVLMMHHHQ